MKADIKMQFSGFWIKKKNPTVRINWSNLIEPVTLFENQINSAEVYFWLCLFSYVYIRNLNWLLLYLYLQVNAGFIAPNIRWLEFLHKYHNYANKKHKVYLGEKKKIMTMIYFFSSMRMTHSQWLAGSIALLLVQRKKRPVHIKTRQQRSHH